MTQKNHWKSEGPRNVRKTSPPRTSERGGKKKRGETLERKWSLATFRGQSRITENINFTWEGNNTFSIYLGSTRKGAKNVALPRLGAKERGQRDTPEEKGLKTARGMGRGKFLLD